MHLGISSFSYAWAIGLPGFTPQHPMRLLDLLDEAARLDVRVVQVSNNLPINQIDPQEVDCFEERAAALGIKIELAKRGIRPAQLREYLALAKRFKSPFLRVVIDTQSHAPSLDEVIELLKPMQPEFEAAGLILAIENYDCFSAHALVNLVHRLGSDWTGICLDTANSFGVLEGPRVVIETLAPFTVNLHLKDLIVYRTADTMSFIIEGRPLGQGMLNVPWVLDEIRQYGRDVNAILEMLIPPEDSLETTIDKERRWLEESIAYLRPLVEE